MTAFVDKIFALVRAFRVRPACLTAGAVLLVVAAVGLATTDRTETEAVVMTTVETDREAVLQSFRRRLGDAERLSWSAAKGPKVEHLKETFANLNYDWESLLDGDLDVPRVLLASVPQDLDEVTHIPEKKAIFFKTMLPLVLQVNEEITQERLRLMTLHKLLTAGADISATDRAWLVVLAKRYRVKGVNTAALLQRVDTIPVSLALSQAAEESGWGTSRFAREANALFGQWTFSASDKGLAPKDRAEGKTHRIKAFDSLLDSVRAYARNLNTHRAYRELRALRAKQRLRGISPDGAALAGTLNRYSERGEAYVKGLRAIISVNDLSSLDDAHLRDGKPVVVPSA